MKINEIENRKTIETVKNLFWGGINKLAIVCNIDTYNRTSKTVTFIFHHLYKLPGQPTTVFWMLIKDILGS